MRSSHSLHFELPLCQVSLSRAAHRDLSADGEAVGWERKVVRSLDDFFSADKDARHRVLGGTAVTALGDHSLTLSKPFDETGSTELEFDYCVIATVCSLLL